MQISFIFHLKLKRLIIVNHNGMNKNNKNHQALKNDVNTLFKGITSYLKTTSFYNLDCR